MKMLWGLRLSLATLGLFAWAWSAQAEAVSIDWASPAGEGDLDGIHVDTHFSGGAIVTLTDNFSGSNYVPALGTVSTLHFDFGGRLDILFSEAVSDLYLYARDFVPPSNATSASFLFNRPFTVVSGFVGATTSSDSITTTNGGGNGVLLFQGPFEALTIDSEANCIFSFCSTAYQVVTFALVAEDTDGDGIADEDDNCPAIENADQRDTDGDLMGDACDIDDDNDGVDDDDDACPLVFGNGLDGCPVEDVDTDGDGILDGDDICPFDPENDADLDGICGDVDACPFDPENDADGDGLCVPEDACPHEPGEAGSDGCPIEDGDGDGIPDSADVCPLDPQNDADGDGLCVPEDACPDEPGEAGSDGCPIGEDSDGDGIPDSADVCPLDPENDADEDGLCVPEDACPDEPGEAGSDGCPIGEDSDGDGIPDSTDVCPLDPRNDVDLDGICGDVDNCPVLDNPDQHDTDGDGAGDACDADDDGDGVPDEDDGCPLDDGMGSTSGCPLPDTSADADGDGVEDDVDRCIPTAAGAVVDRHGCSIADLCRCDNNWKSHDAYVSCTSKAASKFQRAGLISKKELYAITKAASKSQCGFKPKPKPKPKAKKSKHKTSKYDKPKSKKGGRR